MEKKICEVKNCHLKVVESVSKKTGKNYQMVVVTINGVDVNIGFFNVYTQNAFMRAGVKIDN